MRNKKEPDFARIFMYQGRIEYIGVYKYDFKETMKAIEEKFFISPDYEKLIKIYFDKEKKQRIPLTFDNFFKVIKEQSNVFKVELDLWELRSKEEENIKKYEKEADEILAKIKNCINLISESETSTSKSSEEIEKEKEFYQTFDRAKKLLYNLYPKLNPHLVNGPPGLFTLEFVKVDHDEIMNKKLSREAKVDPIIIKKRKITLDFDVRVNFNNNGNNLNTNSVVINFLNFELDLYNDDTKKLLRSNNKTVSNVFRHNSTVKPKQIVSVIQFVYSLPDDYKIKELNTFVLKLSQKGSLLTTNELVITAFSNKEVADKYLIYICDCYTIRDCKENK